MQKKGQITFFILIGVLIVFLLLLFSALQSYKKDYLTLSTDKIVAYVENCLAQTTKEAVRETAMHGGFYNLPEKTASENIPYFHGPAAVQFSKENWEKELARAVEEELDACLQGFILFRIEGLRIDVQEKKASVIIKEKSVSVALSFPLTIEAGDQTKQLEKFSRSLSLDLLPLISATRAINQFEKNELCLSCLFELADEYQLVVQVFFDKNKTLIYEITDTKNILNKEYLVFLFAEQY